MTHPVSGNQPSTVTLSEELNENGRWALKYASRGFRVFPVHTPDPRSPGGCSCGKLVCDNIGKHPRYKGGLIEHGLQDATTDPDKIGAFWSEWPDANIGIATGAVSGIVVVDCDPRNGGDETLHELERKYGPNPETPQVLTGGGGEHIVFGHPGGYIKSMANALGDGLDIKADGGFVVAPPSLHVSGRRYEWDAGAHIDDLKIAPVPGYIRDRLESQGKETKSPSGPVDVESFLEGVSEGQRDAQTFRVASKLRRSGVPYDVARDIVMRGAANAIPPFQTGQALKCLDSAYDRYIPHPTSENIRRSGAKFVNSSFVPDMLPVPQFPVTVFPEPIGAIVEEGARALGVPPDLIAGPVLVFAGATIGHIFSLEVKPGYLQLGSLYLAQVALPGTAKSPALSLAQHPLNVLQTEAHDRYRVQRMEYDRLMALKKGRRTPSPDELIEPPVLEHFFSTDSTLEAIAQMLQSSPGFAIIRDELVAWIRSFDAYRSGRGADRQNWLSLWGSIPLKIDRKTAPPIYVARPVVGVCGGVQPDLLPELSDEAGRRDGFIERLLWCYPDTKPAAWSDDVVSETTKNEVVQIFRSLRASSPGDPIRFSPKARELWRTWYDDNATLTHSTDGILQGVYAKMPNQTARLALILHCLTYPDDPRLEELSESTLDGAIRLSDYFKAHARRVIHRITAPQNPDESLGDRIERILRTMDGEWIRRTAIHRALNRNVPAEDIKQELGVLEIQDRIERRRITAKSGRAVLEWRWKENP